MIKRSDELGPTQIVALARAYIHGHLARDLRAASIAKAIGVWVLDLKGSYDCSSTTSLRKDVKTIRLHALYEAIRFNPSAAPEGQIKAVGLKPSKRLDTEFEEEFWISLADHRQHCLVLHGRTTHTERKFSSDHWQTPGR